MRKRADAETQKEVNVSALFAVSTVIFDHDKMNNSA